MGGGRGTIRVGTSGWQYADWRGVLYPPGVPQRRWLETYAGEFGTVESNAAFYRLPARETFARWRDATPPSFVMAVKASRYLTHVRRLAGPDEPVARLLAAAGGLGPKLGPVLLQLPPTLAADFGLLGRCLRCFPAGVRVAVEFRHPSWWTGETRDVLAAHGAALCWADRRGRPVAPLWRPASFVYLRLHEGTAHPVAGLRDPGPADLGPPGGRRGGGRRRRLCVLQQRPGRRGGPQRPDLPGCLPLTARVRWTAGYWAQGGVAMSLRVGGLAGEPGADGHDHLGRAGVRVDQLDRLAGRDHHGVARAGRFAVRGEPDAAAGDHEDLIVVKGVRFG
jgi:uncharacterized protein YecE (DUF72 family)